VDALVSEDTYKLLEKFVDSGNTFSTERLEKLERYLWVPRDLVLQDLHQRAAKESHLRLYKELVARHKQDGTLGAVAGIVEHVVGRPEGARADWPTIVALKDVLKKLKVKHDAKRGKRATLMEQLFLFWRDLPIDKRPPRVTSGPSRIPATSTPAGGITAAAAKERLSRSGQPAVSVTSVPSASSLSCSSSTPRTSPSLLEATAASPAVMASIGDSPPCDVPSPSPLLASPNVLLTCSAEAASSPRVEPPTYETLEEDAVIRVDSRELAELERLQNLLDEENLGTQDEEVEEGGSEFAIAQEVQCAIACTLDSLAGDIHTCGRCKGVFLEIHMHVVMSGPWRNNWVCLNAEECITREGCESLGQRKRKASTRFERE